MTAVRFSQGRGRNSVALEGINSVTKSSRNGQASNGQRPGAHCPAHQSGLAKSEPRAWHGEPV
jgi:hypothetical protein